MLAEKDEPKKLKEIVYSDIDSTKYLNFNMNQNMCLDSHEWDTSALPTAEGTEYTYAAQNCKDLDDITKIPYKFYKKLKKAKGGFSMYFKIANITPEIAAEVEAYATAMNSAIMYNSDFPEFMDDYISVSWVPYNETDSIAVTTLNHYGMDTEVTGVDEQTVSDIYSFVNDAFGTDLSADSYTDEYYDDVYYYEESDEEDSSDEAEDVGTVETKDEDPMYADEDGR